MTAPLFAAYPDLCGLCHCAVGDHYDPYQSDDDILLYAVQAKDWDETVNCCSRCNDCTFYAFREWGSRVAQERRLA